MACQPVYSWPPAVECPIVNTSPRGCRPPCPAPVPPCNPPCPSCLPRACPVGYGRSGQSDHPRFQVIRPPPNRDVPCAMSTRCPGPPPPPCPRPIVCNPPLLPCLPPWRPCREIPDPPLQPRFEPEKCPRPILPCCPIRPAPPPRPLILQPKPRPEPCPRPILPCCKPRCPTAAMPQGRSDFPRMPPSSCPPSYCPPPCARDVVNPIYSPILPGIAVMEYRPTGETKMLHESNENVQYVLTNPNTQMICPDVDCCYQC